MTADPKQKTPESSESPPSELLVCDGHLLEQGKEGWKFFFTSADRSIVIRSKAFYTKEEAMSALNESKSKFDNAISTPGYGFYPNPKFPESHSPSHPHLSEEDSR